MAERVWCMGKLKFKAGEIAEWCTYCRRCWALSHKTRHPQTAVDS